jgi:hypothetical protein
MRITIDVDQQGQATVPAPVAPASDTAPQDGGAPSASLLQSIAAAGDTTVASPAAENAGPPPEWLVQGIAAASSAPSSNGAAVSAGSAPTL